MDHFFDTIGKQLANKYPDKFRLTPDKRWVIKSGYSWMRIPERVLHNLEISQETELNQLIPLLVADLGKYVSVTELMDLVYDLADLSVKSYKK